MCKIWILVRLGCCPPVSNALCTNLTLLTVSWSLCSMHTSSRHRFKAMLHIVWRTCTLNPAHEDTEPQPLPLPPPHQHAHKPSTYARTWNIESVYTLISMYYRYTVKYSNMIYLPRRNEETTHASPMHHPSNIAMAATNACKGDSGQLKSRLKYSSEIWPNRRSGRHT